MNLYFYHLVNNAEKGILAKPFCTPIDCWSVYIIYFSCEYLVELMIGISKWLILQKMTDIWFFAIHLHGITTLLLISCTLCVDFCSVISRAYGSGKEDSPLCNVPGFENTRMKLLRHVSFVDCPVGWNLSLSYESSLNEFLRH